MQGVSCHPTAVTGLLVVLSPVPADAAAAREAIEARPGIEIGECRDLWLAVAYDGDKPDAEHAWIERLPGVAYVEVVFVGFNEGDADPAGSEANELSVQQTFKL
jgi:hypothetical protein